MPRRLSTLATALGLALLGTAAPAVADDPVSVPRNATITVDGHGFGHGRGLSQYGAQYAAQHGRSYRQIVDFYYPHTAWGSARRSVRVWITGDTSDDVQVGARRGLSARKVGGGPSWNLRRAEPRADRWRIVPLRSRASVLQYHTRGWHRFRKVRGSLEFTARNRPIRLYGAGGRVSYRGALRSVPFERQRLTVNVVPLETYLRGVVPAEMPPRWHQQALRAQAVAARTYAAAERAEGGTYYDLDDTTRYQVYGGASAEYPTTDRAVRATARQILTYGGTPAATEFTASSGGWTVDGDAPYLPAQEDRWDSWRDPNHSWTVRFSDRELERAWRSIGNLRRITLTGRDGNGQWGGRVGTVTLRGSKGTKRVAGEAFAATLHLRSSWLNLRTRRR